MKILLKQSWQIAWQNPTLWFLGIFSTFLIGNEINLVINNTDRLTGNLNSLIKAKALGQSFLGLDFLTTGNFLFVWPPLLILFILAIVGQIGLIQGIKNANQGQSSNLGRLFKSSGPHLVPVFLLNLINLAAAYCLALILGLPFAQLFLRFGHGLWLAFYFTFNLIVFIPLAMLISFVIRLAVIERIYNSSPFWTNIKKAWQFFAKNWLRALWLSVILMIVSLVFGLGLFVLAATAITPFLIIAFVGRYLNLTIAWWPVINLGLFLVLLIFFLAGGIFSSFQNAVWVLFYRSKNT